MDKIFFTVVLGLSLSSQALADEIRKKDAGINAATCRHLVEYQPAADVDYKPGVDVHGKPVAAAEEEQPAVKMPEKFSFAVTVDVAKNIGIDVPPGTEGKVTVGTITSDHGNLLFNGKPMESQAEAGLRALCASKKEDTVPAKPH